MNLNEAYAALGLTEGASKEEAKKAFRKLAAKHHPDKAGGNEAEFKKVNEAYQFIETGKDFGPTQRPQQSSSNYGGGYAVNIEDLIRQATGGHRQRQYVAEDKKINISISFRESVIGCQKQLSYKRKLKCNKCDGAGYCKLNNGCTICGGSGTIRQQRGNFIMEASCNACGGMQKIETCMDCNEKGYNESDVSISANIPPGVKEGRNILRLQGVGDYAGSIFGSDQYASVLLHITVDKANGLRLEENDVVTDCTITLLEALEGTKKFVQTIDGIKEIEIPTFTKNKDEILCPNLGVSRVGCERVIIQVEYPTYLQPLIDALKVKES